MAAKKGNPAPVKKWVPFLSVITAVGYRFTVSSSGHGVLIAIEPTGKGAKRSETDFTNEEARALGKFLELGAKAQSKGQLPIFGGALTMRDAEALGKTLQSAADHPPKGKP